MNGIHELHAYRNDDGTWRIEALSKTTTFRKKGYTETKETTEATLEIERADIQILAHSIACNEPTIFKLEIKD